ncbi:hypothetical protein [Prolixibacter sp. SD074]|jgi:hypothetical protein|uniref:hypothetical protein n=1 Tax=Prolixibacter sp. SD074 TaxID=2652391 RepID=UPI001275F0A3|nr:hypothetical protein [Prolixibacter sp. SD074]GET29929.1 hypothetical protein SD074_21310 [Prolixibacter sp. SD074]
MKRLKSLIEVDFAPLSSVEALAAKGGGQWVMMNGQYTYLLDEVTVTGQDQSFDYGEFFTAMAAGAAGGAVSGAMYGGAAGSTMGPAGTVGGAVGGAIIGGVTIAVGAGITDYIMQQYGY